jgi:ABC-type multidrug transport system fused ATPase/permease subunit
MDVLINGQLFQRQIRTLRGLHGRLTNLKESRANDQNLLDHKLAEAKSNFTQLQDELSSRQFVTRRLTLNEWDEQLEKQMAFAERATLESLHSEKAGSRRLKKEFNENKAKTKADHESASQELKRRTEEAQRGLARFRDSILEKLESQRTGIQQQMHEVREWIGLRTGNIDLQNMQSQLANEPDNAISGIHELPLIAREFEAAKKALSNEIHRMQSHPAANRLGVLLFLGFGIVVGALAAVFGWLAGLAPLIIGLVGLFGSIVATAIAYLAAAPWITRTVGRMIPSVVDQERRVHWLLNQGRRIAESNYQNELTKLNQTHTENQLRLDTDYKNRRTQLVATYNTESAKLETESRSKRESIANNRRRSHAQIDESLHPKWTLLQRQQLDEQRHLNQEEAETFLSLKESFVASQRRVVDRWNLGCKLAGQRMEHLRIQSLDLMPAWDSEKYTSGNWPRIANSLAWRIGTLKPTEAYLQTLEALKLPDSPIPQHWPVFFDVSSHGSLILHTSPQKRDVAEAIVRNVVLRANTAIPPGMLQTTIIDPEGLGKPFTWLMSLADADPALVNHRVWTQPLHIAEQLAQAARHVEDTIQQSLRDRFRNLMEYNRNAGPMAVPYRLIVWANFPLGLDDHSWQSLCSILSSGGKCGVGVILQLAAGYHWPSFAEPSKLREFGLHIRCGNPSEISTSMVLEESANDQTVAIDHSEFRDFLLVPELPPNEDRIQQIIQHQLESVANLGRRIVPFASIASDESQPQQASSADGLSIPIGISDSGRIQNLKLGQGTSQHVVIAGKTGSGKSSLLHTLITSAALKYSPEQLRLVLLDFKKGVEFQVYAETQLSHADIIGIESKREFGVSVLEYLDRILSARGEAFRQWGVQDLPSLARKHPEQSLPRILVLIDEFQELFVEDDKLSQQAAMFLDRIVRQGRSFGIHLILASQTLGGAFSLPRTTLSQMAVRIALQCDGADAMLILSEDNVAAQRLRHSGQAIYNEGGGRLESNQNFQVSFIEKSEQIDRLNGLPRRVLVQSATTNPLGRQVIFEGHKPAVWDAQQTSLAMNAQPIDEQSVPMFLGDSVSIDPPIVKLLSRNAGRNVMVVGSDESLAASLLGGLAAGMSYRQQSLAASSPSAELWILDGTRSDEAMLRQCISSISRSALRTNVSDMRGLEATMQKLQTELDRRNAAPDADYPTLMVAIVNLARFRELRKGDEFAFGNDQTEGCRPDAVLSNLLREGPALGIHLWLWADSTSSLTRWLARSSQRDLELRVLMQMSAADSNQLIDTSAANRLEKFIAMIYDDLDGKPIKFRPFELQSILSTVASE